MGGPTEQAFKEVTEEHLAQQGPEIRRHCGGGLMGCDPLPFSLFLEHKLCHPQGFLLESTGMPDSLTSSRSLPDVVLSNRPSVTSPSRCYFPCAKDFSPPFLSLTGPPGPPDPSRNSFDFFDTPPKIPTPLLP